MVGATGLKVLKEGSPYSFPLEVSYSSYTLVGRSPADLATVGKVLP